MKTLLIYESTHHGNTKKLCDRIAENEDVTLFEVSDGPVCFDGFDTVGFASGIAFTKFYKKITEKAETIPAGKRVFFLYTCGKKTSDFSASIAKTVKARGCTVLGSYGCKGYDTFGPLKLIGGISKGHPNEKEISGALEFYRKTVKENDN